MWWFFARNIFSGRNDCRGWGTFWSMLRMLIFCYNVDGLIIITLIDNMKHCSCLWSNINLNKNFKSLISWECSYKDRLYFRYLHTMCLVSNCESDPLLNHSFMKFPFDLWFFSSLVKGSVHAFCPFFGFCRPIIRPQRRICEDFKENFQDYVEIIKNNENVEFDFLYALCALSPNSIILIVLSTFRTTFILTFFKTFLVSLWLAIKSW